jgi:predicted CoA-binding protein
MKKTVILGASDNPERYAFKAAEMLQEAGHAFFPVGNKKGKKVLNREILPYFPKGEGIDTLTLYLNPVNQQQYYAEILELKPKRIIFNPGAENPELARLAGEKGIFTEEACTLVLLRSGQY